jgi:hypothetical protein
MAALRFNPVNALTATCWGRPLAPEANLAAIARQQSGDHGDSGGLAGSVGAEQAVGLALLDAKRDVVDRNQVAKSTYQAIDAEYRFGHASSLSRV